MTIKKLKSLTKEEFLKYPDATESIYIAMQNSKKGWIEIWKEDESVHEKGILMHLGKGFLATCVQWIDGIQHL